MAINFTDSPSNGATQTISGRTYTYNSAKNKWDTTATEVTGPTATVYASVDNLPTSGNITGSQAFVSGTNRLYIWNGSGWYNIALINTTPSISGASATYDLANDGTATTVTLVASDPEGLPITYSIASDTSGNIATVAQGTGASTNVFTITPSTNTAYAGTFSLTFRASDGVNLATAVSSFTLQFSVANQRYTTALITSVGTNNATNASFDDKSSNNHTITANGDAHQTTFSPYRHGGYSVYFDGSGDNLGFASLSAMNPNTYMSLECWVKLDDKDNANELIVGRDSGYWLMYDWPTLGVSANKFGFGANFGGSWAGVSSTTSPESGVWYHVVGVRENTAFKIYVNGTLENTATYTSGITTGGVVGIAANTNQLGGALKGYLADVRVVISASSSSLPYTSNFTPSTDRLTAVTDTQLLACHLPYMKEGSTHGHTITMNGNAKVAPVGPHDKSEYAAANHLGSASFDGTGDYLHMPQTSLDLAADDFCVEAWVYTTSTSNQAIIGSYRYADGVGSWNLNVNYNSNKVRFFIRHSGGTVVDGQFESGTFPTNQWVHVAVTRDGANLRAFINGTQAGSTNTSLGTATIDNAITTYRIGVANDNNIYWNGNIADVRVVKGSSVYTSNFTPTTAPLTAITNTIFLLQNTDAGIIDKTQTADFVALNGGTKSSTTQNKYLSSSMYFDGVDDTITVPQININAGEDFTIECWHYLTSRTDSYPALFGNYSTWGTGGLGLFADHSSYSGGYQVAHNGTFPFLNIGTVTYNQWVHVALVRNGTTMTLYVDGTSAGSGTSGSVALPGVGTSFMIGRSSDNADGHIQGYLSDFRVTKGLARYTSNFTAPTAALQG